MVKVPPPIWALLWLLLAAGASYLAGWPRVPGLPIVPLGVMLVALGLSISIPSALLFRREGTEIDPISEANKKLVISGLFRFTRNPMYLGFVIVTLGIAIWIGAWPMLLAPVATFAVANWVHIPFEEAKMRRQFGDAYDNYVHRVRRWI
jgi:protein-S-isoprenylcysteine O-methyltransferase Ste14